MHTTEHQTTRNERYFAQIEFAGGKSCDGKSGNLKKLTARCKRGFAGETTDWGHKNTSAVKSWTIRDWWMDGEIVADYGRE